MNFLNKINYSSEDFEYQREEIDRIEKAIEDATNQNGVLTDEDIDNIKDAVGIEIQIEKEKEYVKTLSLDERYAKRSFDKNNIIEVFGFCWSKNSKNGDPYVANSYKSIIFHLADYILNGDAVNNFIKNFNLKWVENFLSYKIKHGYPKTHFRGYTPFNIFNFKDSFLKASREGFKVASFQKLVKILKQYVNILQKERLLPLNAISTKLFDASDYISRNANADNYTKIEYTLDYEEIEQLLNASFYDPQMQLATNMYIIQMFAGGLRPIELYKGNIRFTDSYVSFYRSKNKKISKNPILPEVMYVLKKYPNGLPPFLKINIYREQLKKIADHFKWDRIIEEPNTKLDPKTNTIKHKLKEIFSPLTARKTFINYLANLGLPDELIIQFTDHTDVRILKHYKRKLNLEQKRRIIQKLMEDFAKSN